MKSLIVGAFVFAAMPFGVWAAEGQFSSSLPPDDFTAAGLAGLTSAQLARLNALVEDYKSGALTVARHAADEALAAKQAAEARAARSEANAEAARADATKAEAAKAEAIKSAQSASFIAKAKVLLLPGAQVEIATLESTIPGKFRGWEPHQIFTLANGQRWQVANADNYFMRAVENPKVQLVPSALTGYWLRFPDLDLQVRVKLVEEK